MLEEKLTTEFRKAFHVGMPYYLGMFEPRPKGGYVDTLKSRLEGVYNQTVRFVPDGMNILDHQ